MFEKSPRSFLWCWHTFLTCVVISYKRNHVCGSWAGNTHTDMEFYVLQLYFWKSKVSLVCHPSHLSPWKGYPENWETIWLRNLSPCERTVLSFGSGSPGGARLHSSFLSPPGDRVTWLFSTESWPERGHESAQTAGNRLRTKKCVQVNVQERALHKMDGEMSSDTCVLCRQGGLFVSEGFCITSVLRWVSLWENKIIFQEWFSQENQLSAFGSCNGLSECMIEHFLVLRVSFNVKSIDVISVLCTMLTLRLPQGFNFVPQLLWIAELLLLLEYIVAVYQYFCSCMC